MGLIQVATDTSLLVGGVEQGGSVINEMWIARMLVVDSRQCYILS